DSAVSVEKYLFDTAQSRASPLPQLTAFYVEKISHNQTAGQDSQLRVIFRRLGLVHTRHVHWRAEHV
ncbi:hypothetical protein, partial [Pseudomonas kitaguniensis]|uniref:hypothetical protein n=1 Tax=Pseudomonas kitaguniensis TaxID=2607908 RepID=UPI003CFFE490